MPCDKAVHTRKVGSAAHGNTARAHRSLDYREICADRDASEIEAVQREHRGTHGGSALEWQSRVFYSQGLIIVERCREHSALCMHRSIEGVIHQCFQRTFTTRRSISPLRIAAALATTAMT